MTTIAIEMLCALILFSYILAISGRGEPGRRYSLGEITEAFRFLGRNNLQNKQKNHTPNSIYYLKSKLLETTL